MDNKLARGLVRQDQREECKRQGEEWRGLVRSIIDITGVRMMKRRRLDVCHIKAIRKVMSEFGGDRVSARLESKLKEDELIYSIVLTRAMTPDMDTELDGKSAYGLGSITTHIMRRRLIFTDRQLPVTFSRHTAMRFLRRETSKTTLGEMLDGFGASVLLILPYSLISDNPLVPIHPVAFPTADGLFVATMGREPYKDSYDATTVTLDQNGVGSSRSPHPWSYNGRTVIDGVQMHTYLSGEMLGENQERIRKRLSDLVAKYYGQFAVLLTMSQMRFFDMDTSMDLVHKHSPLLKVALDELRQLTRSIDFISSAKLPPWAIAPAVVKIQALR